ncbi:hypothetical protein BU17DRAFT_81087 [Hysterangium stoloniferum]|nr:hypothetical protein BU17DRAFT_81087 [Hysterangium stoloniferum]
MDIIELDGRQFARYRIDEETLEAWRTHACLPKTPPSRRSAFYEAAKPFFVQAARFLVEQHAWQVAEDALDSGLFSIHPPGKPDTQFTLPNAFTTLFQYPRPCERMFDALFQVSIDLDGNLFVAEPLTDIFHLLQLLAPGCFALVKAHYVSHEVDDEGEVAFITWRTESRALPNPSWMDNHAQHSLGIVDIFGRDRWAMLRRAAADFQVIFSGDVTFG